MYQSHSVPTRGLSSADLIAGFAARLRTLAAVVLDEVRLELAVRARARRDRRHLLGLDHRLLADVGLNRYELHRQLNHRPFGATRYD